MNTTRQTRFTRTAFRAVVVVGFAAVAMTAATMTAASAAHKTEGPGSAHAAEHPAPSAPTVSSPCFAVRTPDKWPASEVGQVPRCSHVFGATDSFGSTAVAQKHPQQRSTAAGKQQAKAYAARHDMPDAAAPAPVDSPCFMSPQQWRVQVDGAVPVCP